MVRRRSRQRAIQVARLCVLLAPLALVIVASSWLLPTSPLVTAALTPVATPTSAPAPPTPPDAAYLKLTQQRAEIGLSFTDYYAAHQGATWLGDAILPEVTTAQGEEQIFQGGVLRLGHGTTGEIAVLPVVTALLKAGALMPLGDGDPRLTYATLAAATGIQQRVTAPWWWRPGNRAAIGGIFVPLGTRGAVTVGHYIPATFAAYLTGLGNWQAIAGVPLTEAQAVTVMVQDMPHHEAVQAFERLLLYEDEGASLQSAGTSLPPIAVQEAGSDYLAIFGPPATTSAKTQSAWTVGSATAVQAGPGVGATVATFLAPFPVTLTGDNIWLNGVLWYRIAWQNLDGQRDGWVPAAQVDTRATAGSGAELADLGALTPQLNILAQQQQQALGIVVYVPEENRTYAFNPGVPITIASTIKVPILMALLKLAESQGRSLTPDEQGLAEAMIERSDNDAATVLYQEINYDTGLNAFFQAIGISGFQLNNTAFGLSTATPEAMVQVLAALLNTSVLTDSDRQYVLDLMGHVEADQQMGIGTTAPPNATYALKDGWIQDDTGWVANSAGIVTSGGHAFIVAVFSNGHASLDNGWQIVNAACAEIANELGAKS